jgi:hypothetical protein
MALRIFTQRKSGLWDPLGHKTGTGLKLFNGIRVALPGALPPYLALGLVLGFFLVATRPQGRALALPDLPGA